MFNKKQIVRNFIFSLFCVLILVLSFTLTYYVTFYNEEKVIDLAKNKNIQNLNQNEDLQLCDGSNINYTYFINSFLFKLMGAFFAGGILSDGMFIKMGII